MRRIILKVLIRRSLEFNHDFADETEYNEGLLEAIIISSNFALPIPSLLSNFSDNVHNNDNIIDCNCVLKESLKWTKPARIVIMDSQVFSSFSTLVALSKNFRVQLLRKMYHQFGSTYSDKSETCPLCYSIIFPCSLQVNIFWPKRLALDYNWNYKVEDLVFEYCELEILSAWLSTLGGAFSSLGENSSNFAEKAQKTSLQQMKIAVRRNDHLLMSRCRIYYAMSLIQKDEIKKARRILENEFKFAKSNTGKLDFRLANMCLGVWAKLKFVYEQKQRNRVAYDTIRMLV